ncbi:MAG TPA: isoleucine--tRNA ligase [Alphaproteobacteria bacterium]|nr:isoleucine--tRNA ligase [Alphaproteobacteria bacterium]
MTQEPENKDKFRDTVFLPKTDFPMRGNLPENEPSMIKKWQEMDLYAKIRDVSKGRKRWILHDGPPYANGNIHMGHALNKILKDVINKSWQMMGYDAPYVPGWDCHGLPIEWKIEEKYRAAGKDKNDVDPITFRAECRDFAQDWIDIQAEQFQRLGVIGDWKNPYRTMTKPAEAQIVREIHKFLNNGGLYRGVKSVLWSTVEQTALAEAEVEYKEHKSITIWARFPVIQTSYDVLEGADIVIWTTTPWTIPSNRGIFFNKDIHYAVYEIESVEEDSKVEVGAKIAIAEKLKEDVQKQSKILAMKKIGTFSGKEVSGTLCAHPLRGQGYEHDVPAFHADYVTDEDGTGFVHVAPSHGPDDFVLGQQCGLEITDNLDDDGSFKDHVPLFAGLKIYDENGKMDAGNFAPIKAMEDAGKLLAKGSVRHEYPHSWRSKAPLIFRTTPQWFIAMDNELKLRETALKAIKDTAWHPAKGESRITAMIQNRPDWCISRQRAWGVPIALFVNKKSGEVLKDEAVLKRIGDAFEEQGSDAWWSMDAKEFLGENYNVDDYEQVFDIVDVWFESGSTHSFVVNARKDLGDGQNIQTDMYLEGSDQHRGWFHSSLLESCGTRGFAPYKNVLTHGFVLDEKGYKMSKSLGNVVDPLKIMEQSGADILRLWTMTSDYADDIRIGKDTLKNTSDLYRRIRNTLRFLLGALHGFKKSEKVDLTKVSNLPELEQLILHQLYEMDQQVKNYIQNHEYGKLAKELHDFCNQNLSAFYFDIRKDRLYCDDITSFEHRATRSVMAQIFDCLVLWLAPILSFTAEEAWLQRPAGVLEDLESVHLRTFPTLPKEWKNIALNEKWALIQDIREAVTGALEKYRADKTIGSSLEAAPTVKADKKYLEAMRGVDMADIAIVSNLTLSEGKNLEVEFKKADGEKCVRCWKVLPEVSAHSDHICNRCDDVVNKKAAA